MSRTTVFCAFCACGPTVLSRRGGGEEDGPADIVQLGVAIANG